MATCPQCGQYLIESAKFCTKCGHSMNDSNSIDQEKLVKSIQSKLSDLNTLDYMGLECLKCGSQSNLTLFKHTETVSTEHRRYTSYKTRSINIPFCQSCNSELTDWIARHSGTKSRSSYYDVVWLTLCGFGFGIGMSFTFPIVSVIIFSLMTLAYIYIFSRRRLKKQESSPFRYIKFRLNNTYVKPRGQGEWIKYDMWLNTITQGNQFAFD
jgi:hypothetical protein